MEPLLPFTGLMEDKPLARSHAGVRAFRFRGLAPAISEQLSSSVQSLLSTYFFPFESEMNCIAQAGLKLKIFLPQLLEDWGYGRDFPSASEVLFLACSGVLT